ncbi:hypothetical protein AAFG13_15645 [Bradyrhizobium sp. B124]|uniref:hypothetical protein n=1 Tax=Bradyrhizobium sp. B124 TaxID=3140245 RepID=UPI003182BFCF
MTFIFDTALFTALMEGRLKPLSGLRGHLMATDNQLRAMRSAARDDLCSRFLLGRSAFITEGVAGGDGRDVEWEQNGPDFDELAAHLGSERHPEWKADVEVLEVALNEKAVLVSDRRTLRDLMEHFEGQSVSSLEVLQH